MRKVLKRIMHILTICAILALGVMYLGRYMDPLDYPLLGLFTLGYPFILVLNLVLLLFWAIKRDRWAVFVLAALLATWSLQSDFFRIDLSRSSKGGYSLVSFNTQLFGFYQFKKNKEIRDHEFQMLDSFDADIFCFQEFYKTDNPKGFQTLSLLEEQLGPFYIHEKYTHEFVHKQYFGVVTLSKFPILYRGYIPFEAEVNNFCIYSDILLPTQDTIRVFNTHLASIHFRAEDYAFSEGEFESWEEFEHGGLGVMGKLKMANARRSLQIKTVLEEVAKSHYPVMFAGDFNAPPFSYAYRQIRSQLEDAFCAAGSGISNTYKAPIPMFRIDHVFHDEDIKILDHRVVKEGLSDHFPVLVHFDLNKD